ncbi:cadherin domain-containing protein [Microvirga zambiensis]|uniref:cadherin domain-containing protein n=1 Tax=Microvirga zambiensis TaxID=1402137 RepID=UPI00191F3EDE|nr:cadherin domain-containing protein [Microvirga zambiensis]
MAFTVYRGGSEIQVNTVVEGDQTYPSVTTLADGGWITAWSGPDGDGTGIFIQRFNAAGERVLDNIQVNTQTASDQYSPVIAALPYGGWVVAWHDTSDDALHLQRFSDGGSPVGAERTIAGVLAGDQNISITGLPDNSWVVTWSSTTREIMQQRFNDGGQVTAATLVYRSPATDEDYSSVSALKGAVEGEVAGWVVVWSSSRDNVSYIGAQTFNANGAAVGRPFRVGPEDGRQHIQPKVAALADGGWVVTWQVAASETGNDLYQQVFNGNGTQRTLAALVSHVMAGDQHEPSVTALADGGWVVSFTSVEGIVQRHYDPLGRTIGPDVVVAAGPGNQRAGVTALPDNRGWVVTWENQDEPNSAGIAQRVFSKAGDMTLTAAQEIAVGTDEDDLLLVEPGGLSRDIVTGNLGTDTLQMEGAGQLDLSDAGSLSGIERLIGSDGNDTILADADRLADVTFIDGGLGTNTLVLNSNAMPYELSRTTIANFSRINLGARAVNVLVADAQTALLIHTAQQGTMVEVTSGSFELDERLQLFRQGVDFIVVGNERYEAAPPDIGGLNGDRVTVAGGHAVRLDRDGDAVLLDSVGRFDTLTVAITNRVAEDSLGIDVANGSPVTLSNGLEIDSVVSVNGTRIGTITAGGSGAAGLAVAFDDAATMAQVQALLRVLTYANGNPGSVTQGTRDIAITLANDAGRASTVNVEVAVVNAPPEFTLAATSLSGFDTARLSLFAGAAVSDDTQAITLTVKLDDKAKGVLIPGRGGSYEAATGEFTFSGSAAEVTQALAALQFDPRDRSDPVGSVERTTFTVTIDDGTTEVAKTLTVDTRTANRTPAVPDLVGSGVKELSDPGTPVGKLSAGDPNGGDTLTYSLIGAPQGVFAISGDQLVVQNGIGLDYEQTRSYTFTIRATDAGGLFNDRVVTVNVEDVNPERTAGSGLDDRIVGGSAADVLSGGAGADILAGRLGKDILRGDGGRDVFVFDTRPNKKTNVDTIKDFSVKDDSIWLDNAVFKTIGKGTPEMPVKMKAGFFHAGKAAHDRDDRIIYDKATGKLFYDEDGTGRKAQVEIALLKKNLKMTAADFFVI